jgi:hypothetical protein
MTPIDQLKAAGFDDKEIGDWSAQQRNTLSQAGFSNNEVDTYLAGPKEPVPQAFTDRLRSGVAILENKVPADKPDKPESGGDAFSGVSMGEYGPGNFLIGLWKGLTTPAAELKEKLGTAGPGETAGAIVGRVPVGQIIDQIRQGGESLNAVASGQPVSAEEMVGNALLGLTPAPITRSPFGPITRLERDPLTGGLRETPVGELPTPMDFNNAAQVIAGTDAPHPAVVEKLRQQWRDEGIHPSEAAHDAITDPTISQDLLAQEPELQRAYREATAEEPPVVEPAAGERQFFEPDPDAPPAGMGIGAAARTLTPEEESVLLHIDVGGRAKKSGFSLESLYSTVIDRLNAIPERDAAGNVVPTSENPYRLMRSLAGNEARASGWLRLGQVDFGTGDKIGPALSEILAPVRHDLQPFRAFVDSVRGLELEGKGIKTGFDVDAMRTVAKAGEKEFAPIMAKLVEYQNNLVKYMRDAGVISPEAFDAMTSEHQSYIPFHALMDEQGRPRGAAGVQPQNPLFRIEGSERVKIDPLESIIQHTHQYVAMAERNKAANALVKLLADRGEATLATDATLAENKVRFFDQGVEKFAEVPRDVADAVKNVDGETADWLSRWLNSDKKEVRTLAKVLTGPARTLRAGATLTPDFALRNIIRDYLDAVMQSEKPVFTPIDSIRGYISALTKDEAFRRWTQGGGGSAEMVGIDRQYLQEDLRKMTTATGLGNRAWNVVRHPLEALRTFSELSEQATRLGEFKYVYDRELKAGATRDDAARTAAFASREVTIDFARRGTHTQALNLMDAFWNANVQGTDRFIRQMKDHPVATGLKIAGGIVLPSTLLWAVNHDDPRYREMPGWQRDLFWLVMTNHWTDMGPAPAGQADVPAYANGGASWRVAGGRYQRNDGTIIRIPKPFSPGVLFGSGAERMLDAFATDNPSRVGDYVNSLTNTVVPLPGATVATPMIEQFANKSSFTGSALIPQYLEKQLPEYQYTPYTTETAKKLGQLIGAFPGVKDASMSDAPLASGVARALTTPILLENYLRAFTGGMGMYALQIADSALRSQGLVPNKVRPDDTLADIPVVRAFVVRYPSASTDSIQHFYTEYTQNQRYFTSWKTQAQEGNVEAAQRIQAAGGMRMFLQLDQMHAAMGKQAKMIRDIDQNPQITSKEKRQLIDTLYYGQIQLAQQGLGILSQADHAMKP